jgi:hypothetical protein
MGKERNAFLIAEAEAHAMALTIVELLIDIKHDVLGTLATCDYVYLLDELIHRLCDSERVS